jgi:DNA mismatch repair protein MutS2
MAHPDETETEPLTRGRERFAGEVLEVESVLATFERHAASSLGVRALRELAPLDDEQALAALARVAEMQLLRKAGDLPSFAGVCDPWPKSSESARRIDEERFIALRGFLDATGRLQQWFAGRAGDVPKLGAVAEDLPDVSGLLHILDTVLDERGRVRRDATDLLARLRRAISELSEKVDSAMRRVLARGDVRTVLSDGAVHRRGGRPVLAVRARSAGHVKGLIHDRSSSGESVFVEPKEVIELGNRLAESHGDERREVERILVELTQRIRDQRPKIRAASAGVARLELAWICARYCEAEQGRAALQPGDPDAAAGLLLRGARHPLLIEQVREERLERVVPIDVRLGGDFSMLIITGPNTGGKTVALKTAGLFALLTRMGLPVPAREGTTVPLYDRVAADIGDEQEIRQNLSTFASHLVRIRGALEHATSNSLVLLDELGGGTDPEEGAALGEAVLEDLLSRDVPTLCSTHIGKLKEFAYRRLRVENASTEFDVETLAPTYQLHIGTPGESGALIIARRMGLPQRITDRAASRRERHTDEVTEIMEDLRKARVEAERLRADAESRLADAAERVRQLEQQEGELDRRGEQLEAEAQKGIEERVRDGLRHLERARALLAQVPGPVAAPMKDVLDALEAELSGASLSERRQGFLDSMRKGSLVYLPRYRQRMLVHKVDRAKREVTCKLGSMKVSVSFDEVTPYEQL